MSEPVVSVRKTSTHTLGVVGMILAAIIGAGTIIGQLGGAFFVTRGEYNKLQLDSEAQKKEANTVIENANKNIVAQIATMERLWGTVEKLKEEVEKMNVAKQKKR